MANILFASNNIAHFPGSTAGIVGAAYDGNRVPYSIAISNYLTLSSPTFVAATGDETWLHFTFYTDDVGNIHNNITTQMYDANDNLLFRLIKPFNNSGRLEFQGYLYDGSNSVNGITNIQMGFAFRNNVDIRYRQHALGIELEVFINSVSCLSQSFPANPNNYGNPVRFALGASHTDETGDKAHYSEIIVSDEDTRNARLDLLRPQAAGAYSQWGGSLAVLADDDSQSGMTTIAADQRETMTLTPYSGAPNISNLVAVSSTTRGQNSPTKLKHTVRLSTVDYDGPEHDIGFPLQYVLTDFELNPATSLAWTDSDIAAVEVGFVSVA